VRTVSDFSRLFAAEKAGKAKSKSKSGGHEKTPA
jgi:hypothetical protein